MPTPNPFAQTLLAVLPLFLLMATGVAARRARVLREVDIGALTRYALDIALPALIVATLATRPFSAAYLLLPLTLWAAQTVGIAAVLLAARWRRWPRPSTGAALFALFGNTAFLGYPVTSALYPALLPATVILDQFGMWLMLYGVNAVAAPLYGAPASPLPSTGSEMATRAAAENEAAAGVPPPRPGIAAAILTQTRSPLFLALFTGLALRGVFTLAPRLAAQPAVAMVIDALRIVAAAAVPVIMVALGMRLSADPVRRYAAPTALLGVIKLAVMPAVAIAVARYALHLHGGLLGVCALESAVPPAATSVVFSTQYGMNTDLAIALFFVLTLASAITLPLILAGVR